MSNTLGSHSAPIALGSFAASTCAKCGGALLGQFNYEEGKTFHFGCAPSTKRKDRLSLSRERVIASARGLAVELAEYDAAKAAMKWSD